MYYLTHLHVSLLGNTYLSVMVSFSSTLPATWRMRIRLVEVIMFIDVGKTIPT